MTTTPEKPSRKPKRSMDEVMKDKLLTLKARISDAKAELADKEAELKKIEAYLDI